jgi:hypothetical protein
VGGNSKFPLTSFGESTPAGHRHESQNSAARRFARADALKPDLSLLQGKKVYPLKGVFAKAGLAWRRPLLRNSSRFASTLNLEVKPLILLAHPSGVEPETF